MKTTLPLTWMALALLGAATLALAADAPEEKIEAFEQLLQKVQTNPGGAGEEDALKLLQSGRELGRSYAVSLAMKGYLAHHFQPSPEVMRLAAENAFEAGDHRGAVSRYKTYLKLTKPGEVASRAAALMLMIDIDLLGAEDDAYLFMSTEGEKFRQTAAYRKFEPWYLEQAAKRQDFPALARGLATVMGDKLPLEQERLLYWEHLDYLMNQVRHARTSQYAALPAIRKIVPAIRDSKQRSARYGFYAANLEFEASSAGKDPAALARSFQGVAEAARAYVQAYPTAETVEDVVRGLAGGDDFRDDAWSKLVEPKRALFVWAFEKLGGEERTALLNASLVRNKSSLLAEPVQWAELGGKYPDLFAKAEGARDVTFATNIADPALIQTQAAFLKNVPSRSAAVINSLAAGGDDLAKAVDHLMRNEAWHLDFTEAYEVLSRRLWPAWRTLHTEGEKAPADEVYHRALVHFGKRYLSQSPAVIFDPEAAKRCLESAWRTTGEKKTDFIPHLEALDWVPFAQRDRNEIVQGVYRSFKSWADNLRKEARKKDAEVEPARLEQISPLEEAFKVSMKTGGDPARAPNDLCRKTAEAVLAERRKDAAAYARAATDLYPMVKDYTNGRTPFAAAVFAYIFNGARDVAPFDVQMAALADLLKSYEPGGGNDRLENLLSLIFKRREWSLYRIHRNDVKMALRMNEVLGEALATHVDKGRLPVELFAWFRGTRVGNGWSHKDWGARIYDQIIAKRLLDKVDWRPSDIRSATVAYMWMVRHDVAGLEEKYPVESHFDDAFVEEARKTGFLDRRYWDYGRDTEKKVVNCAAEVLDGHKTLPFGYNGEGVVYSRSDFWDWQARALGADPKPRDAMTRAVEATWGKTRFDTYAMGRAYFSTEADLKTPAGRKDFFDRLDTYTQRQVDVPARVTPPYMGALVDFGDPTKATKAEVDILLKLFPFGVPSVWHEGWHFEDLALNLHRALVAQDRATRLYELAPFFWGIARDTRSSSLAQELASLARGLLDEGHYDLAYVYSSGGLDVLRTSISSDVKTGLTTVRSKTIGNIGNVIPVKRGEREYPIYVAQASYLTGKFTTAWDTYAANRALVTEMYKDLDPNFLIWLIGKHTELRQFEPAEQLAQRMIQWFDSVSGSFDAEVRGRLQLAYADIALARREFPRARALYEKIAVDPEFEGTDAKRDAELAVAEVDRLTGRFDEAAERLEKLARAKDPYLQTESFYHLALVSFDQSEYAEALDYLQQVFDRAPDHANAKILEARANVKMNKLEEPTDVEIGPVTRQRFLIPSKPLKITLEDRNLTVVGPSTDIQMRVWTESGDEEIFSLVPFGDTKTKFRGTIPTTLAPAKKASGTLELLGSDTVYYDYAEAFKKEHRITDSEVYSLTVRTDARLDISSGKILSDEEREALALEREIRARLAMERGQEGPSISLNTVRPWNQIKPGNDIKVRVEDLDRSRTPKADTLKVRIAASSGDTIAEYTLTETGTHTGVFEGSVPTASGQARAYASDSDAGKDPNMVISAKDYPAWVGLPGSPRPQTFSVDLNDNVALGKMAIKADVPGRKFKNFRVQTSLNARSFTTVGAWPNPHTPWDGALELTFARFGAGRDAPSTTNFDALKDWMETGYISTGRGKGTSKPKTFAAKWDRGVMGHSNKLSLSDDTRYIAHLRGTFTMDRRQVRTFQLDHKGKTDGITYVWAIDGELGRVPRGGSRGEAPPLPMIKRSLGKGVHVVDVFVIATRTAAPEFEVLCDTPEPPYMVPCPAAMFDVAGKPEVAAALAVDPAKITAAEGDGAFTVEFPAGSRGRVVRLVLVDFETDAPAIDKITLTDAAGETVLPTETDFMELRENQVLEIVPGDRVTVSYEDPLFVTRGKEHHEAFLTATYTNAVISATFVEYQMSGRGERTARYIPMRRFEPGDKVNVFINDPDMDVSDKLDTVPFTVRTSEGRPTEHRALETAEHSGIFLGSVFPVEAAPRRDSEIRIVKGDDIILTYVDAENTDPGIPWNRTQIVEQVWFEPPELRAYDIESMPLAAEEKEEVQAQQQEAAGEFEEYVPVTRTIVATWPELPRPDEPAEGMIGLPLLVEVLFPAIAKSPESSTEIFVQTSSGRKAMGLAEEAEFNVNVPGTIRLTGRPSNAGSLTPPPGYKSVLVRSNPYALEALDDGRYTFSIPMELGKLPEETLALEDETVGPEEPPVLKIKGDDDVFIGYRYTDPQGQTHWLQRRIALAADAFFDIMDRRYQETVDGIYVGEVIYFRLIDPTRDASDDKDTVELDVTTSSGTAKKASVTETFSHSGVFKGFAKIVYRDEAEEARDPFALPVTYGDEVTVTYTPPKEQEPAPLARLVSVYKGSDGEVLPFTKRFKDPAIAMQTQFTIAEAYFELAKRHRELDQQSLARREIMQGKKLLEEAIRDFPDTEARAQADYLLANLALEFANDAVNEDMKQEFYVEAINRFSDIVASYPDSIYAPKAQYKKALVFEKMGKIDTACEEYVKLSYRYPDNELVAETIARLGQYFLVKGKEAKTRAEAREDPIEREKVVMQSQEMFKTAGQVFGRLAERFPEHRLADKTTVLAAQCFMQAAEYEEAVKTFKKVIEKPGADKDLVAESMYWCGDSYMKSAETNRDALRNAYIVFKKLTWDYPTTKWAKFARGRLTDERLTDLKID